MPCQLKKPFKGSSSYWRDEVVTGRNSRKYYFPDKLSLICPAGKTMIFYLCGPLDIWRLATPCTKLDPTLEARSLTLAPPIRLSNKDTTNYPSGEAPAGDDQMDTNWSDLLSQWLHPNPFHQIICYNIFFLAETFFNKYKTKNDIQIWLLLHNPCFSSTTKWSVFHFFRVFYQKWVISNNCVIIIAGKKRKFLLWYFRFPHSSSKNNYHTL